MAVYQWVLGLAGEGVIFFTCCKYEMCNAVFCYRLRCWIRYKILDTLTCNICNRHFVGTVLIGYVRCVVVAPMYLVAFWVTAPLRWVELWPWTSFFFGREKLEHLERLKDLEEDPKCMHQMLRDCPGGLGVLELQEFLEDPMSDPQVRQDEKSRPTTVEHIKQLRDRIEKTNEANLRTTLKHVEREMARKPDHADARLARLEQDVVSLREGLICKMDRILDVMQESGARSASKCE